MKFLLTLILICFCQVGYSQIVVITSEETGISNAEKDQIVRVFLGRSEEISGTTVKPVEFAKNNGIAEKFRTNFLEKTPVQYEQYWARLIFTGKAMPPYNEIASPEAMAEFVSKNKNTIGYTLKQFVDGKKVKILAEIAQ